MVTPEVFTSVEIRFVWSRDPGVKDISCECLTILSVVVYTERSFLNAESAGAEFIKEN